MRELDGVAWYNDSKATNVDATLKAIAAFDGGLWVILGGKDKNSDYSPLAEPLRAKAHGALLIGAAADKIEAQLRGAVPLFRSGTMDAAVAEAGARAKSGDTVLLAPACASFDQFENFEHPRPRVQAAGEGIAVASEEDNGRLRTDWILFLTIVAMVGFGLVMLYSASSAVAELRYHVAPYYFVVRQIGWAAFSFLVLMYFKRMDYRRMNTPAWAFSGLGIVLGCW